MKASRFTQVAAECKGDGRLSGTIDTKTEEALRKQQWRHQALAETLYHRIAEGEFPVGSALPTERDIAASEKVSRATVREALRFLENHGMIRRRQGSGTVVIAREPQRLRMPLDSLEALLTYPQDTEVEVQSGEPLSPDDPAFAEAELESGGNWWRVTFQRRMQGASAPVSHIDVYLPEEYAAVEADIPAGGGSVFLLVEDRFGIHPAEAVVRIDAVQIDARRAQALGVAEGSAAVRIQRRYSDAAGRLYQVSVSIYPQDRYVFETVIRG
ncbi:GntR family transcriptional regulator [Rhizobiaceae bacterium BDR2-2]|uniref:GntR family transcriptional regulator n=1 Tax=Ectorhizobium quercum TaxID=2965071 RepID=A0AAE3N2U1_9HYPH|nr:GntR family transcriptional regulator [Ectorhizobium quercum]MCX9000038.1 GntR family transcriptional regulator [Ectorhizobium quercum]